VITLAQHGWQALGVDFSAGAVAEARRRLRAAGVQAELLAADVTRLDPLRLGEPFDLLLDIGCFHALSPKGRGRYAAQLPALVRPGALFLLYTFLSSQTGDNWPSEAQLRHHFKPDFHIERFERGHDHAGRRESAWLWLACNS
jgi:cyclopropane fatty-acyl-phospholipid synthase-like methyltransferase